MTDNRETDEDFELEEDETDVKKRSRAWVFTYNNWPDHMDDHWKIVECCEFNCEYAIFGYEISDSGTEHLQGYMYFKDAKTFKAIKDKYTCKRIHLQVAKGTPKQNYKYCSKQGNFHEWGKLPQQGRRSDFDELKEDILNGMSMQEIRIKHFGLMARYQRQIQTLYEYLQPHRTQKPIMIWLYGVTGCGKTRLATSCTELYAPNGKKVSSYYISHNASFMDGYEHQYIMIFDDVDSNFLLAYGKKDMLRILDRYEYRVNVKGSHAVFNSPLIFITSDKPPTEIMQSIRMSKSDIDQLMRRVDLTVQLIPGDQSKVDQVLQFLYSQGYSERKPK